MIEGAEAGGSRPKPGGSGAALRSVEAHDLRLESQVRRHGCQRSAKKVKQLRDENARLKKLVADLSLDKDMLQSVIRKNSLGLERTRRKCSG